MGRRKRSKQQGWIDEPQANDSSSQEQQKLSQHSELKTTVELEGETGIVTEHDSTDNSGSLDSDTLDLRAQTTASQNAVPVTAQPEHSLGINKGHITYSQDGGYSGLHSSLVAHLDIKYRQLERVHQELGTLRTSLQAEKQKNNELNNKVDLFQQEVTLLQSKLINRNDTEKQLLDDCASLRRLTIGLGVTMSALSAISLTLYLTSKSR